LPRSEFVNILVAMVTPKCATAGTTFKKVLMLNFSFRTPNNCHENILVLLISCR
jgi:hypothetical protein